MMNQFQNLLGKNKSHENYIQFENQLISEATIRENNISSSYKQYDFEILYKQDGILVSFLNDVIIAVKVYFSPTPICQPFRNEFVFGLSYISSENDIKKQFNFPKNLNLEPMRADNIYQYENCTVAFDAMTGEINYAEIRII